MVYAAGFAGGEGGRNRFERSLMNLRIVQNRSRSNQSSETVQSGANSDTHTHTLGVLSTPVAVERDTVNAPPRAPTAPFDASPLNSVRMWFDIDRAVEHQSLGSLTQMVTSLTQSVRLVNQRHNICDFRHSAQHIAETHLAWLSPDSDMTRPSATM